MQRSVVKAMWLAGVYASTIGCPLTAQTLTPDPSLMFEEVTPVAAARAVQGPILQAPLAVLNPALQAQAVTDLPEPVTAPLDIDFEGDPVLGLANVTADPETFRSIVVSALQDSPTTREAIALENAAEARVSEARSGLLPVIDVNLAHFQTFDRQFTNDPQNLIERSRARDRTDFTLQLAQPIFSFGAARATTRAAAARLEAAGFQREARAGEVAGEMVIAWTRVFGYQALERLYDGFVAAQDGLDDAIERRIAQGVSAEGDRARVASLRAQGNVQLAQARRQLASAEAQFEQLSGFAPPERLLRPPLLDPVQMTLDYAQLASQDIPQVRSYEALADARLQEARAARARRLPNITGRVDFGRYGILEDRIDYDLRGTLNVGWRFFGGGVWARARAANADANAAVALADSVREEAARDAAIAWADVKALEEEVAALDASYRAARQSRDIVVARFSALRGSLFDVADAQGVYLNAAGAYIRSLAELDAARYILILRTGRMTELLNIEETEIPL